MTKNNENITVEMSENDMKTLVRNALMVAGQEMGETGDHWPVIKNTITDIMHDWEMLEAERAFQDEMKAHLYGQLKAMEEVLATCSAETQAEVAPRLAELREIYDAHFERPAHETIDLTGEEDADKPVHIKRAEAILRTLEEGDNKPLQSDVKGIINLACTGHAGHKPLRNSYSDIVEVRGPEIVAQILKNDEIRKALSKIPFADASFALAEDRAGASRPMTFVAKGSAPTLGR